VTYPAVPLPRWLLLLADDDHGDMTIHRFGSGARQHPRQPAHKAARSALSLALHIT